VPVTEHPRDPILGIRRRWWSREPNKPWIDEDKVKISVRAPTDEADLPREEYFTVPILQSALEKIYDFYGKNLDPGQASVGNLVDEDIHDYSRPNLRPLLLISIDKITVESALRRSTSEIEHPDPLTVDFSTPTFLKKIKAVRPTFERYQKQYQYFDGRTSPQINFIHEYNRLEQAYERIVELIEFNNLELRTNEDDVVRINFDQEYHILDIVLLQNGLCKRLSKGNIYFLDDTEGLKDLETNQILYNLSYLYATRGDKTSWSDFVNSFMDLVEVDFFGRPCTNKASEMLKQEIEETNKLFQSSAMLSAENFKLASPEVQQNLINTAIQEKTEDISARLGKVAEKIRDANNKINIVKNFINKFGINHLIEAALECLAFKTGADLSGIPQNIPDLPPLPGVNPYEFAKPGIIIELPPMDAIKLPTVDILKGVTEEIKEGLKQAGIEALTAMIQTIAEIIVEICLGSEEEPGSGLPIPSILDQFPSAVKVGEGETPLDGLNGCYEDYEIDPPTGNIFLMQASENLTPREICDLLNGSPASYVLEIIHNIISSQAELESLRASLASDKDIVGFFVCLSKLVSPDYCASVYAAPRINVNELDPCTIEDKLLEDNELFDDLIDAYKNLDDKINDLMNKRPDLSCGGGIVPALADMPAFAYSIGNMMEKLFEMPKTTFVSDISGLKPIMVKPSLSPENKKNAEMLELLEKMNETGPPKSEGADMSAKDKRFLSGLMPAALLNNPMVRNVQETVDGAVDAQIARLQGLITYEVARAYKDAMASIDRKIATPFPADGSFTTDAIAVQDLQNLYFTLTDTSQTPVQTIYLSPGAGSEGQTKLFMNGATQGQAPAVQAPREQLEADFFSSTFANYSSDENAPNGSIDTAAETALTTQLYVPGYLSLLNSLAFNIRKSELFDVSKFNSLILTPVSCPDIPGTAVGKDLLDIQGIIDEALKEFADNSCSDRTCIIGPIEDSIMFGATNAYIQVLLLEQLLKNIFLMDAYGMSDFMATELVTDRIINEIYTSIGTVQDPGPRGTSAAYMQSLLTFDMLKDVSVYYVEKQRMRLAGATGGPLEGPGIQSRLLPDPSDPTRTIEIPENITIPTPEEIEAAAKGILEQEIVLGSRTVPASVTAYRRYSLEYMIKRRITNAMPAVKSVFAKSEPNFNISLLRNGLPVTDVLSNGSFQSGFEAADDDLWRSDIETATIPGYDNVRVYQLKGSISPAIVWVPAAVDDDGNPIDEAGVIGNAVNYDYGVRARLDERAANSPSLDEGNYARTHGLYARERYVRYSLNYDNLTTMSGLNPGATSLQRLVYAAVSPALDHIIPGRSTTDYDQISGPSNIPVPKWDPIAATSDPEASGSADITVSVQQFNSFINTLRGQNPSQVHAKLTQLLGIANLTGDVDGLGIEVTYILDRAVNDLPDVEQPGQPRRVLKGPLTSLNYDPIRFWINEVQNVDMDETIRGAYYPATDDVSNYFRGEDANRWGDIVLNAGIRGVHYPWNFGDAEDFQEDLTGPSGLVSDLNGNPTAAKFGPLQYLHSTVFDPRYDSMNGRVALRAAPPIRSSNSPNDVIQDNHNESELFYIMDRVDLYNNLWNMAQYWGFPYYQQLQEFEYQPAGYSFHNPDSGNWISNSQASERFSTLQDNGHLDADDPLYGLYNGHDRVVRIILSMRGATPSIDFADRTIEIPLSEFEEDDPTFQDIREQLGDEYEDMSSVPTSYGEDIFFPRPLEDVVSSGEPPLTLNENLAYASGLEYVDRILNQIISNIRIGNRVIYNSPELETISDLDNPQILNTGAGGGLLDWLNGSTLQEQDNQFYKNKANFLVKNRNDKYILNVDTGIKAEVKVANTVSGFHFTSTTAVRRELPPAEGETVGESVYYTTPETPLTDPNQYDVLKGLFEKYENPGPEDIHSTPLSSQVGFGGGAGENSFIAQMASQPEFAKLFNTAYDSKNMVAFLFLYGLMVNEGNSRELNKLFNDTKMAIRVILKAALSGGDYTYKDSEAKSPSDLARDSLLNLAEGLATDMAQMGGSFILKMLIETPIRIFKGICELIEPHVAIGKIIRDVSGQVIQVGEQIWETASSGAQMGTGIAEGQGAEIPPELGEFFGMSLVEIIEVGIDEAFHGLPKFLRPSVSEKGINLVGKMPWLFCIPPTPWFGIPYILLDLLESCPWCPTEEQLEALNEQCSQAQIQIELAAEQEPDMEAEAVTPSSTIDCQPPPKGSGCLDDE